MDKSGIKVTEYMTELPKRELLEQKLYKAVELARKQIEAKQRLSISSRQAQMDRRGDILTN